MNVKFKILENGLLPKKQTSGSSGYDVYSSIEYEIKPNKLALIPLGFIMEIEAGFEAQVRSRSGIAFKNQVFVLNSPGTIDSDYRSEVCAILMNLSSEVFYIQKGDRIAQIVFAKVESPEFEVLENLTSSDRVGGFGSTGL